VGSQYTAHSSISFRRFDEVDGDILFVYAKDEDIAAEIEDNFALYVSIIATNILRREVGIVLVLPKQLAR
jgi:hypothetical protein